MNAATLANPRELSVLANQLIERFARETGRATVRCGDGESTVIEWHDKPKNLYVVSPQRAGNLGFVIADKMGIGTNDTFAVSVIENHDTEVEEYSLSSPIPPDATVLFVTDVFDDKEIEAIASTVLNQGGEPTLLCYTLCLTADLEANRNHYINYPIRPIKGKLVKCPSCKGKGGLEYEPGLISYVCEECHGDGRVRERWSFQMNVIYLERWE